MPTPLPHRLSVSAAAFQKAVKTLKSVQPKGRHAKATLAVLDVGPTRTRLVIPGGAVAFDAVGSGPFAVELPWPEVPRLVTEFKPEETMSLEFGDGLLRYRGITVKIRGLRVSQAERPLVDGTDPSTAASDPVLANPMESLETAPLGLIYNHFRLSPPGTTPATRVEIDRLSEAHSVVNQALRYLERLGLDRDDLDDMLARRLGGPRMGECEQ